MPVFEESPSAVEQSKILVGEEGDRPVVESAEAIAELAFEEKPVSKVDESRIIVNNEEEPKKKIDDDDLGSFLKSL